MAARAEVVSVPPADPPSSEASPPPPTVLRGSPLSATKSDPTCPPGYTLSPGYGCLGPSGGDYGYDYWPDYGYGYPFGGFGGFGFGAGRFHRFAGLHGSRGFHDQAGFRGFHARAGFHGAARSGGIGVGHMGGFGRR
jgi:hypothetical protein